MPKSSDFRIGSGSRKALAKGDKGILKIAAEFGVGSGTVQRIKAEAAKLTPSNTQQPSGSSLPLVTSGGTSLGCLASFHHIG